jgi:cysteinyl-tRNA synthetase
MTALGVGRPPREPGAHAYIGQVIALAAGLLDRGSAYERDGRVYVRGAAVAARAVPDPARARSLAAEYGDHPDDPRKDDPFDVAVWQASGAGELAWASPWGPGRPGWHAECAAMALHSFGPAVDVHAGGGDLRFPHHAYQAAMAEAFTGVTPFARARFNVGVVSVAGAKMAKSAGNLVLVGDLLTGYPAAAVRLLILDRRWDADWDYRPEALEAAAARLERLQSAAGRSGRGTAVVRSGTGAAAVRSGRDAAAGRPGPGTGDNEGTALAAVRTALAEDLDVPAALRIAEEEGGPAARTLGALLGLW